ncbi:type IV secretory system conjugative DNA transfer family protein [Aliikangiella maris]|uniref:TraM recognition domain-containing protein n=2 Tax=Aliikangiella maris TaxID=3162458 RepID=A0ABV3MSP0_9GAMM
MLTYRIINGDEDYLEYLSDPDKKVGIYYVLRGGSGKIMASLSRMVVGIAMLHCMRNVRGARSTFYLEEAATLGRAEFIKQAVSECRKYFHTILIYQSPSQLIHLFGKAGAEEILDSCGQQIYLGGGIRNINSATSIADAIGKTSILVDDPMAQADREFMAEKAWRDAMLRGEDVLEASESYHHQHTQSHQGRYTGRYLIDPAEIMRLKNEVIILSPGAGLPPILAQKLPNYWQNPAMAGRYAPDPLFPPLDSIKIKRKYFWGSKTRKFIRMQVPEKFAHWPNHVNGEIAYVQGYRTW